MVGPPQISTELGTEADGRAARASAPCSGPPQCSYATASLSLDIFEYIHPAVHHKEYHVHPGENIFIDMDLFQTALNTHLIIL